MSLIDTRLTQEQKAQLLPLRNITGSVNVPVLKLSPKFLAQIAYYHHKSGNIEWSGPLMYSREGVSNLDDLLIQGENKTMELTVHEILLADIGTSGYTSYTLDDQEIQGRIMDYQMEGMHMGLCHTHHNMKTFFSGTDNEELQENTPNHKMYLSLIVNFSDGGSYSARICSVNTEKIALSEALKGRNITSDQTLDLDTIFIENKVIDYIDLNIQYDLDELSIERYSRIVDAKQAARSIPMHHTTGSYPMYNRYLERDFTSRYGNFVNKGLDMVRGKLLDFIFYLTTVDFDVKSKDIDMKALHKAFAEVEDYNKVNLDIVEGNFCNIPDYVIEMVWGDDKPGFTVDEDQILEVMEEAQTIVKKEFSKYKKINSIFKDSVKYWKDQATLIDKEDSVNPFDYRNQLELWD